MTDSATIAIDNPFVAWLRLPYRIVVVYKGMVQETNNDGDVNIRSTRGPEFPNVMVRTYTVEKAVSVNAMGERNWSSLGALPEGECSAALVEALLDYEYPDIIPAKDGDDETNSETTITARPSQDS